MVFKLRDSAIAGAKAQCSKPGNCCSKVNLQIQCSHDLDANIGNEIAFAKKWNHKVPANGENVCRSGTIIIDCSKLKQ